MKQVTITLADIQIVSGNMTFKKLELIRSLQLPYAKTENRISRADILNDRKDELAEFYAIVSLPNSLSERDIKLQKKYFLKYATIDQWIIAVDSLSIFSEYDFAINVFKSIPRSIIGSK